MSKIDKSFLNKAENENKLLPLAAKFVPKYSSENTNYYRIENIESLLSNCIEWIKNKFKIYQVKADGNCFYRALSYFLYNIEDNHNKIREDLVNYASHNIKIFDCIFQQILENENSSNVCRI